MCRRIAATAAVFVAVVFGIACNAQVPPAASTADVKQAATVLAGASSVDITPVPGLPTAGHGKYAGAIARGYWDRLRATAFYFEDPDGRGFALVSADLFGMPTALHQSVAAYFTAGNPENLTKVTLPPERLIIAATHTHQGPANYLSALLYNSQASKLPGFNPQLRGFLARQLIRAIELAIVDARSGRDTSVDVLTELVGEHLFLNRSPMVFKNDSMREEILSALGTGIPSSEDECVRRRQPLEPKNHWKEDGCPRLRAVDRNVTILRLRRDGRTRAMALFLSVHPTVLPASTELFSGDLFGVARMILENSFGDLRPVVGFFNGSEGDIVARRTTRSAADLMTLSRLLATRIREIHDTMQPRSIDLSSGVAGRLHFAVPGDTESLPTGVVTLTSRGLAGNATLGGGEGDPSKAPIPYTGPLVGPPTSEHGVKVPALGPLHDTIGPPHAFPQALPIGFVRLGSFHIVALPTESSTAAVWRLRKTLGDEPHGALEVISMANEYASYLSTEQEYAKQDYMGASTFWGPKQSAFFEAVLDRMRQEQGTTGAVGPDAPGDERHYRVGDVGNAPSDPRKGFDEFLKHPSLGAKALPAFEWCTPAPTTTGMPSQHIEVVATAGPFRDDLGILTVLRGRPKDHRAKWAAIWLTPLWDTPSGSYKFRVLERGRVIESQPFSVGSSPPPACDR